MNRPQSPRHRTHAQRLHAQPKRAPKAVMRGSQVDAMLGTQRRYTATAKVRDFVESVYTLCPRSDQLLRTVLRELRYGLHHAQLSGASEIAYTLRNCYEHVINLEREVSGLHNALTLALYRIEAR
jgi:hypothetical protein